MPRGRNSTQIVSPPALFRHLGVPPRGLFRMRRWNLSHDEFMGRFLTQFLSEGGFETQSFQLTNFARCSLPRAVVDDCMPRHDHHTTPSPHLSISFDPPAYEILPPSPCASKNGERLFEPTSRVEERTRHQGWRAQTPESLRVTWLCLVAGLLFVGGKV